jgi:hypothetical protein
MFPESDDHHWMIISDPNADPAHVVIVCFITYHEYSEEACIVEAGEHPFIKHRSCVDYAGSFVTTDARLEQHKASGALKPKQPLSPQLLQRIRDGVSDSRMRFAHLQVLRDQGFVE